MTVTDARVSRGGSGGRWSRRWRRRAMLTTLVAVFPLVAAVAAHACDGGDCSGGSAEVVDNREVEARAFDWTSVATGTPASSPSGPARCSYAHLEPATVPMYVDMLQRGVIPGQARFYRVTCGGEGATSRTGWWLPGGSVTEDGAFHDVLQEAIDRLAAPRPQLHLTPAAHHRHLVGVPTWLAVTGSSWTTQRMQVSAGEVTVEVELSPRRVGWDLGDGAARSCDGPGPIFDPSVPHHLQDPDCTHTWLVTPSEATGSTAAVAYRVRARIAYDASYRLTAPEGRSSGDLGRVFGPTASADVVVRQYQAVRIP